MSELLSKVIPLSLGAAVSPTVLAAIVLVLGGRRSLARGVAFTLGVFTVLAALTMSGLVISHHSDPSAARIRVTHDVYGLLGVVLLSLAVISLLRPRTHSDTGTPVHTDDPRTDKGLLAVFALGFGLMISNLSTILLYLPAMHSVSASSATTSAKVVAVVIALAITSIPVSVPMLLRIGLPRRSVPIFAAINRFVTDHQRAITIAVEVGFGVYLIARAL
jgi:Sap, sulfolipid-1-addressing protein